MTTNTRPQLAFSGEGKEAVRWAAALEPRARICVFDESKLSDVDGAVIGPGVREPFARARDALEAGVAVLYAAPFALSPAQSAVLETLSADEGVLLRIAEPFQREPGFVLLRRLLAGREPFWRPLYVRTASLGPLDGRRLDEGAIEDLAACNALLGGDAASVSAVTQRDETGAPCAAFITVAYRGGVIVQCTVSLAEATPSRQLVAVTADRTAVLDRLDPGCTLRVIPNETSEKRAREACCTSATRRDPFAEEVADFVQALRTGDRSIANVGSWKQVAAIWSAACESMGTGESAVPGAPALRSGRETPPMRVIEGGGARGQTARPALTLVAS